MRGYGNTKVAREMVSANEARLSVEPLWAIGDAQQVAEHPESESATGLLGRRPSPSPRVLIGGGCLAVVITAAAVISVSVFGGRPTAVSHQALFGNPNGGQPTSETTATAPASTAGTTPGHPSASTGAATAVASSSAPGLSVPAGFVLTSAIPSGPVLTGMSRLVTYVGPGSVSSTAGDLSSLLQGGGWKLTKHVDTANFAGFEAQAEGWVGTIMVEPSGTSAGGSKLTIQLQDCAKTCPL